MENIINIVIYLGRLLIVFFSTAFNFIYEYTECIREFWEMKI